MTILAFYGPHEFTLRLSRGCGFWLPFLKSLDALGQSERWITVHPHGKEERGYPVKIVQNKRDKSWTVAGGAGGVLNGLRLTHVKTPHEYRVLAVQRHQAKAEAARAQKEAHLETLREKHRAQLHEQNAAKPEHERQSDTQIETRARQNARIEQKQLEAQGHDLAKSHSDHARDAHKERIALALEAQGHSRALLELPDAAIEAVRARATRDFLRENPQIHDALGSDDPTRAGGAARRVNAVADKAQRELEDRHFGALKARADALEGDLRSQVAAAHGQTLGRDATLAPETLRGVLERDGAGFGDAGTGYERDYETLAQNAGAPSGEEYDAQPDDFERRAQQSEKRAQKVREAAAALDEVLASHGLAPSDLGALETAPRTVQTPGDAAATLVAMQRAKELAKAHDSRARDAKSGVLGKNEEPLEVLPKAAVVTASPISEEERAAAVSQIMARDGEDARQKAVVELLREYGAQDDASPLVKHRLSGHNAFWGDLAQNDLGIESPDPMLADVLGAAGTAHVLCRALEQVAARQGDKGFKERLEAALSRFHVENQIPLCRESVQGARAQLERAAQLESQMPDEATSPAQIVAASEILRECRTLQKSARERLGLAVGRLEAGAALNYALSGSGTFGDGTISRALGQGETAANSAGDGDLQISLGQISRRDALLQAGALGLTQPDLLHRDGDVVQNRQYRVISDGHNQILCLHDAGVSALASSLQISDAERGRRAHLERIKRGDFDEDDYLPPGFSARSVADVSPQKLEAIPKRDLAFDTSGLSGEDSRAQNQLETRLREWVARGMDQGLSPLSLADALHSRDFLESIPDEQSGNFARAVASVFPRLERNDPSGQPLKGSALALAARAHKADLERRAARYHDDFLSGDANSIGSQSLPDTTQGNDVLYQAALQDPRLPVAWKAPEQWSRHDIAAIRDYALDQILGIENRRDKGALGERLSGDETTIWNKWRDLEENARAAGQTPYEAIQERWRQDHEAQKPENVFKESLPVPDFAVVDLNDDAQVERVARANAGSLGYGFYEQIDPKTWARTKVLAGLDAHVSFDPKTKTPVIVPMTGEQKAAAIAGAKARIKAQLRGYAQGQMFGVSSDSPDVRGGFNPEAVTTAATAWQNYVRGTRLSESDALRSVADVMRGDLCARVHKGLASQGHLLPSTERELENADAHARALGRDGSGVRDKSEEAGERASEIAQSRARSGGRFAAEGEGEVARKVEAARATDLLSEKLFGGQTEGVSLDDKARQLARHRVFLGKRIESQLENAMPGVLRGQNLRRGAVAGRADMSRGEDVKRQRAIKAALFAKKIALTLGCVHESTLIFDPVRREERTFKEWHGIGEPLHVYALTPQGEVQVAKATCPFTKPPEEMFKVSTRQGRTVIVTGNHRFLTPQGWTRLADLQTEDSFCVHLLPEAKGPVFDGSLPIEVDVKPEGPATPGLLEQFLPFGLASQRFVDPIDLVRAPIEQSLLARLSKIRAEQGFFAAACALPPITSSESPPMRFFLCWLLARAERPRGFAFSRLLSNLGCALQAHGADGQSCGRTLPSFLGDCHLSGHCGDGQPRKTQAPAPASPQQRDDALECNLFCPSGDGWDGNTKCIHFCPPFARHSSPRSFLRDGRLRRTPRLSQSSIEIALRFLEHNLNALQFLHRSRLVSAIAGYWLRAYSSAKALRFAAKKSWAVQASPNAADKDLLSPGICPNALQCEHPSILEREVLSQSFPSAHRNQNLACSLAWDIIQTISSVGTHTVYDLHVPELENYFAQGILHHNTGVGKTAVSLGLHGELRAKNPHHRTLMEVPSQVQENFGIEAARFFDPQSPIFPKIHAVPGESAEARRAAYSDPDAHIHVVTHAALRDDLTWALANSPATVARFGGDESKAREFLADASQSERDEAVREASKSLGWNHDLLVADEAQAYLNREGKDNSAMANAFDSLARAKERVVTMSADPTKNDWSECHDLLCKVAPSQFTQDEEESGGRMTRSEFKRRYGVNTPAVQNALARLMSHYSYAEKIDPKTKGTETALPLSRRVHTLSMRGAQRRDYDAVNDDYRRLRFARKAKKEQLSDADIEAARRLSPADFAGADDANGREEAARVVMGKLGAARGGALDRVVNGHAQNVKMAMLDKICGLSPSNESGANDSHLPHVVGAHPSQKPTVVFAHSLDAVETVAAHLREKGVRVVTFDGGMDGRAKEAARAAFSPSWDANANGGKGGYLQAPSADVIVCSDAGAAGLNLQRGVRTIHWDSPHTAMVYEQRLGRTYRTGQRGDENGHVEEHALVTDSPYELRRRENLERKREMRNAQTTPSELLDDGGIGRALRREGIVKALSVSALARHFSKGLFDGVPLSEADFKPRPKRAPSHLVGGVGSAHVGAKRLPGGKVETTEDSQNAASPKSDEAHDSQDVCVESERQNRPVLPLRYDLKTGHLRLVDSDGKFLSSTFNEKGRAIVEEQLAGLTSKGVEAKIGTKRVNVRGRSIPVYYVHVSDSRYLPKTEDYLRPNQRGEYKHPLTGEQLYFRVHFRKVNGRKSKPFHHSNAKSWPWGEDRRSMKPREGYSCMDSTEGLLGYFSDSDYGHGEPPADEPVVVFTGVRNHNENGDDEEPLVTPDGKPFQTLPWAEFKQLARRLREEYENDIVKAIPVKTPHHYETFGGHRHREPGHREPGHREIGHRVSSLNGFEPPPLDDEADYRENGVKSRAFKAWFGDWENAPHSASVVRDENGEPRENYPFEPIPVYHGTSSGGFTAFETSKNAKDSLYGPGFYFTQDQSVAQEYQEKGSQSDIDALWKLPEVHVQALQFLREQGVAQEKLSGLERLSPLVVSGVFDSDAFRSNVHHLANKNFDTRGADEGERDEAYRALDAALQTHWDKARAQSGQSPMVYAVYLNIRSPLDMGAPISRDAARAVWKAAVAQCRAKSLFVSREFADPPDYDASFERSNRLRARSGAAPVCGHEFVRFLEKHTALGRDGINEVLAKCGYDGLTHIGGNIMGDREHRVWIAFSPSQIKAVGNRGTFDARENDIYKGGKLRWIQDKILRLWKGQSRTL